MYKSELNNTGECAYVPIDSLLFKEYLPAAIEAEDEAALMLFDELLG